LVYDAGPCGSWLDRDLTQKGEVCWGVAPLVNPAEGGRPRHNRASGCHPAGPAAACRRSHPRLCAHGSRRSDAGPEPRA
jgi:hypothetical protein